METIIECLGCRLANKIQPSNVVYENDYVICFLDHAPFNEGHTLILPKQHFLDVDELDKETASAIMSAFILLSKALKQLYKPDGITVTQNGGIFNELTHYHMHVVPRYKNQSFSNFYNVEAVLDENIRGLSDTKKFLKDVINELK
ncbi:diadenosine tetraphosphate (Ap4A) HIT family hydrolase [Gracilibacillus halotolerans]|uniref:Diadenosine tetraphosphate (Ap4A) HIT family hydrolase n=1 Tax=Gracilibacillus halotolerans TaxID=74386 RepID=A0A841RSJ9_9BACI|nr:HIT family protein [Gracilibacillus halotolerans]MBB6513548.1 diadenosine tetraphosphate (Ap4A) HIT family hydrolase [Gracilibacillus halotolerans]